eukprot:evm.model.scf_2546.2 EVM.evm.TU.scf_2546.2   scf_2546:13965-15323(+)
MNEATTASVRESFTDGRFSDVKIQVKGRLFHLHRLVLCGIPYFQSLFQGQWKDSRAELLTLSVDDPMVTAESFEAVVRAMYHQGLDIDPDNWKGIYATASFLQLVDICTKCVDYVIENLTLENCVACTRFALLYDYIEKDRLLKGCSKYLWINGVDLGEWLPQLPVRFLCEVLKSEKLWVANEFARFKLATMVFGQKLGLYRRVPPADRGQNADEPGSNGQHQRRRCTVPPFPSSEGLGNEGEGLVRSALEHILCRMLHYEHLSHKEYQRVTRICEELRMPKTVTMALLKARTKREALQTCVLAANHSTFIEPSVCSMDTEDDLRSFRFGVELENALGLGVDSSWESRRIFYGGSQWWLLVRRRQTPGTLGQPYGVYVRRAPGDSEKHLYSDKREVVGLEVKVICGQKSMTFHKGDYEEDWGSPLFIYDSEVGANVTPKGALRFMVILQLLF